MENFEKVLLSLSSVIQPIRKHSLEDRPSTQRAYFESHDYKKSPEEQVMYFKSTIFL